MLPIPLIDWLRLQIAAASHGSRLLAVIGRERDHLDRWPSFDFLVHEVVGKEWAG